MNPKKKQPETKPVFNERAGATSALGRAVALHLEGKLKEALKELDGAIERGERVRPKCTRHAATFNSNWSSSRTRPRAIKS